MQALWRVSAFMLPLVLGRVPAEAAVPDARPYTSPDIQPDGRVTFRVFAPKASEVTLEGGWMPSRQTVPLVRDDKGLWSVTVGPLKPIVYGYWFNIDGAVMLDQANRFVRLRTAGNAVSAVDLPGPAQSWAVRDVPHGKVEIHWLRSAVYHETRRIQIYLPPDYDAGKRTYPVLYLFHGAGEMELSWVESGKANLILDNLIADGRIKPMIVVMPYTGPALTPTAAIGSDAPPPPPATGAPQGPPPNNLGAAYIRNEIVPWAEGRFRIAGGRDNRAVAGFSAGGALASTIELNDLDYASSLGMFSSPVPSVDRFPALAGDPKAIDAKLKVFWMGVGRSDPQAYKGLRNVDRELTARGIRHTYQDTEGAHDFAVWRWCLTQFLPLLFR